MQHLQRVVAVAVAVAIATVNLSRSLGELGGGIDESRADETTSPVSIKSIPVSVSENNRRKRTGPSCRPWSLDPKAPSRVPCRQRNDGPGHGPPRPGEVGGCAVSTTSFHGQAH